MTLYDTIGEGYTRNRRPDPRWAAAILDALGEARSVVNIGAGAGSYEPDGRRLIAVEPSRVMMAQRQPDAAPVVEAVVGALPFPDASFDVAMAVLTVHHWPDAAIGLAEMQRVAGRQVVVTWEPEVFAKNFWLVRDYLPADGPHTVAGHVIADRMHEVEVIRLPVPHDCTDGVFAAYWRRPELYLDPSVRASISGFALADQQAVGEAMSRLEDDLSSGAWRSRNAELLNLDEVDVGYRILVGRTRGR